MTKTSYDYINNILGKDDLLTKQIDKYELRTQHINMTKILEE